MLFLVYNRESDRKDRGARGGHGEGNAKFHFQDNNIFSKNLIDCVLD